MTCFSGRTCWAACFSTACCCRSLPGAASGWLPGRPSLPWVSPGRWDTPFFALGVLVKAAWAFEYFWLSVHSEVAFDWARGCYFLCLAVIVMMVSSWPEPFSGP